MADETQVNSVDRSQEPANDLTPLGGEPEAEEVQEGVSEMPAVDTRPRSSALAMAAQQQGPGAVLDGHKIGRGDDERYRANSYEPAAAASTPADASKAVQGALEAQKPVPDPSPTLLKASDEELSAEVERRMAAKQGEHPTDDQGNKAQVQ
jgi:hypothetical protein